MRRRRAKNPIYIYYETESCKYEYTTYLTLQRTNLDSPSHACQESSSKGTQKELVHTFKSILKISKTLQ